MLFTLYQLKNRSFIENLFLISCIIISYFIIPLFQIILYKDINLIDINYNSINSHELLLIDGIYSLIFSILYFNLYYTNYLIVCILIYPIDLIIILYYSNMIGRWLYLSYDLDLMFKLILLNKLLKLNISMFK